MANIKTSNTIRGYFIALFASFLWAGTAPGIKYLLENRHLPALSIALWRDVFVALALVGVVLIRRPAALKLERGAWKSLIPVSALTIGVYHVFWVYSVMLNGAAIAVVLVYLYPAFVTLADRILFGQAITKWQVAGLVVAFVGCALAVKLYDPMVWQVSGVGILMGLATAVLQSVYTIYNQHNTHKQDTWATLGYLFLFGAITLFFITLFAQPAAIAATSNPTDWLILIGLAVGPTLCGYSLFSLSLRYIPGKVAGLITVMEIFFTSLLAMALFGEQLAPPQWLGVILIMAAGILPNAGKMKTSSAPGAASARSAKE